MDMWGFTLTFIALGKIQEYEMDNYGEITSDLSDAEHLANMLLYVLGDEALLKMLDVSETYSKSVRATDELNEAILKEIEDFSF